MILESALLCLAANIYHEARGELIPGQYAVALVTMNRAGSPEKVCKTVMAKHQFSWTTKLVAREGKGFRLKAAGLPKDEHAWWLAKRIAQHTLNKGIGDLTNGSTHYHSTKVRPYWSKVLAKTKQIGRHIFYIGK